MRARLVVALALCIAAANVSAQWRYTAKRDEMTDKVNRSAELQSRNKIDLSFPYGGGTRGRLLIRQLGDEESPSLILWVDRGQLVCGIEECQVQLRFDGGEAEKITARPSAGGRSDGLFLDEPDALIARLNGTKRLLVRAFFYQDGNQVFEFAPQGLKWAPSASPSK